VQASSIGPILLPQDSQLPEITHLTNTRFSRSSVPIEVLGDERVEDLGFDSSGFDSLGSLGFVNVYASESVGGDDTAGGEATSLETLFKCDERGSEAQSCFTFIVEDRSSLLFQLPDLAALLILSWPLIPNVLYRSEASLSNSASELDIVAFKS